MWQNYGTATKPLNRKAMLAHTKEMREVEDILCKYEISSEKTHANEHLAERYRAVGKRNDIFSHYGAEKWYLNAWVIFVFTFNLCVDGRGRVCRRWHGAVVYKKYATASTSAAVSII
jgi:hypothetical protein